MHEAVRWMGAAFGAGPVTVGIASRRGRHTGRVALKFWSVNLDVECTGVSGETDGNSGISASAPSVKMKMTCLIGAADDCCKFSDVTTIGKKPVFGMDAS